MQDLLTQRAHELVGRWDGPFAFRFIIQPIMATLLATRAGLRDAREGRPAFGLAVLTDADHRTDLLKSGWKDITMLFSVAVIVDLIYGGIVLHTVRPVQTLIIAVTVAVVPYLLIRGPVNRIARALKRSSDGPNGGKPAAPSSAAKS